MKITATLTAISGDPKRENELLLMDTIEHEGKQWLVPEWLEAPTEGWKKPARIICLDGVPRDPLPPSYPAKFVLKNPIPKAVLDGQIPSGTEAEYVVIEAPDIRFDIPRGIH